MRVVRPSFRALAATLLPLVLATCTQDTLGPIGRPGLAQIPVALQAPNVSQFAGLTITAVRATVTKLNQATDHNDVLLTKTVPFAADANSLQLSLAVVLTQAEDTLDVAVDYLSGAVVVFSGTLHVIVRQGPPGTNPDLDIPVTYVGPGAGIATLDVEPKDSVVTAGGTLQFRVTALDGQQANVPAFYVSWTSSSAGNPIDANGVLHAGTARTSFFIRAATPTSIRDSSRVTVIPAPASILKVSGDAQTALVSAALPQPLIVEVRGADNLPIQGIPVTFAVASGGGQVDTASVITGSNGRAGTTVKLGATAGAQSFTATVSGVAAVTFTATANPAGPATYTWTGTLSTDWFVAGNWSPAAVPGAADNAIVPNTTNKPTIGTATTITNLTVNTGGVVTIGNVAVNLTGALNLSGTLTAPTGSLTVAGAITTLAGSTLSPGVLFVGSTMSVAGTYAVGSTLFTGTNQLIPAGVPYTALTVSGSASLTGRTVTSSTVGVIGTGRLTLAGHTLVTGLLQIGQAPGETALLVMTNALDSALTTNMTFQAGDETGSLTAGVLRVSGNFNQNNLNSASSFAASGSHKTVLNGTTAQTVRMAQPGSAQSHFNILDVSAATGGVSLTSNVLVLGQLISQPSGLVPTVSGTGVTLTAAGVNVTKLILDTLPIVIGGGTITRFDTVTFNHIPTSATALTVNDPGTAAPYVFDHLIFFVPPTTGFYLRANDTDGASPNVLTVRMTTPSPVTPGAFTSVAGGAVINWPIAFPSITWTGAVNTDWSTAGNWNPALLPGVGDSVVIPNGVTNFPTLSTSATVAAIFEDGRLTITGGALHVTRKATANAGINRIVTLTGLTDSLIVGDSVGVPVSGAGVLVAGGSIGGGLGGPAMTVVLNGTGVQNIASGAGGVLLLVRKPSGSVAFAAGSRVDSVDINSNIPVTGVSLTTDHGFFTAGSVTLTSLIVHGTLGVAGSYTVTSTEIDLFLGTPTFTLPALTYQNLTLNGDANIQLGARTTVSGNLNISPNLGQPAVGLTLNGHTMTVGGTLLIQGAGIVRMTNPLDSLTIAGSATFSGIDPVPPGNLSAGVLVIGGDFTESEPFGGVPFQATGTHKTVLTGASPTVTFQTVGTANNQNRFQNLTWTGAGTLTAASSIIATGAFTTTATGSVTVLGSVAGSQPFQFATRTSSGPTVFDNVRVVLSQTGTGTAVGLDNSTFQNMTTTVAQLTLLHPGISGSDVVLSNLTFSTAPTTGFYISASDNNTSDGFPLVVDLLNPTPALDGGLVQLLNGAALNWPGAFARAWNGTVSTNWSVAGNWTPSGVPTSSDDVTIPSGTPNAPTLSVAATTRNLTVNTGATVNLAANILTVNGSVSALGQISGTGSVTMGAAGTLQGNLSNLVVSAPVTLAGSAVLTGNLTITGVGAALDLNGFSASATGNLSVQGAGRLIETNASSALVVFGSASFDGASEAGFLTAGNLDVTGNFTQAATSSGESFSASGTHRTILSGPTPTVTFATPGSLVNQSRFQDLSWSGTTLTQGSGITISGTLTTNAAPGSTFRGLIAGGRFLQFANNVAAGPLVFDNIRVIVNQTGTGTAFTLNNATFQGLTSTVTQLTVQHPGTAAPIVLNNLVFSVAPTGAGLYLSATDNTADANILTLNLTGTTPANPGALTAISGGAVINWPASSALTWVGTTNAWNVASNWSPALVPTGVDDVTIPAGTPFAPQLTAAGGAVRNLTVATGATLAIPTGILTINGDIDVLGTVTVDPLAAAFNPSGTGRTIRGSIENVNVVGTYVVSGPLVIGTDLLSRGDLAVAAQTVTVGRDLILLSAGTVTMTNAAGVMTIGRNANFTGGSTSGKLTAGRMDVAGNIRQDNSGTGNPANSLSPSGTHTVRLTGTTTQTIDIFNTGLGAALSHFNNLDLSVKTGSADFTRFNTTFVAGTLISNPAAAAPTLTTSNTAKLQVGNVNANGLVLNALPLLISGGTITAFNRVTLQGYAATDIQLTVNGPGAATPFVFDQLTFSTAPTGAGRYLVANDTLVDANILTLNLTAPTPATPGAFATVIGGAVINWPPAAPIFNWVGASANWQTATNWSTGTVPGPFDKVVIAPATVEPTITAFTLVGDLTVNAGATLTVNGPDLQINGNLSVLGTLTGTAGGTVVLAGHLFTVGGTINAPIRMTDAYGITTSLTVTGGNTLNVNSGGILTPGGHTVTAPRLLVNGNGQLVMTNPLDSVKIAQAAIFDGGDETNLLTDGVLVIGDSLVQPTPDALAFIASGNHKTVFNGAGGVLDIVATGISFFQNLEIAPTGGTVRLASNLVVNGNFLRANTAGGFQIDSLVVVILGDAVSAGSITATTGGFSLTGLLHNLQGNFPGIVAISGNRILTGATTAGTVGVAAGILTVNGQRLTAATLVTSGTGTIGMTNPLDTLVVTGDLGFEGGDETGLLTNGGIRLGGNFIQGPTGSPTAFSASGNLAVLLVGTVGQQVHFANPGPATSHFHDVVIANTSAAGVTVDTAFVLGSAGFAPGLPQAQRVIHGFGAGSRLVLSNLNITQTTFDNLAVRTPSDGSAIITKFDSVTFSNTAASDTALTINHPGTGGPFAFKDVVFQTTPAGGGVYLRANDTDGGAALTIDMQSPTPSAPGGLVQAVNGAVINWPAVLPATWLGAASNAWESGLNWSSGVVPTSVDPVTVPAGTPNSPLVAISNSVGSLTVNTGATLDIGPSGALTIAGSATVPGTITGTASSEVTLIGTGTVSGNFDALRIFAPGNYTLSGDVTTTRSTTIAVGASLNLGTHTLRGPIFSNAGAVTMAAALDSLVTTGDQIWDGANELGLLTAGTVVVGGSFTQGNTISPNAFAASGSHKVVFNGSGLSQITMASPGASVSRFQNLVAGKSGGATLAATTTITANGRIDVLGGTGQFTGPRIEAQALSSPGSGTINPNYLEVSVGDSLFPGNGEFSVDTVSLGGGTIPGNFAYRNLRLGADSHNNTALTLTDGSLILVGGTFTMDANVTLARFGASATDVLVGGGGLPQLNPNGHALVTPGNLTVNQGGLLIMTNAADSIDVGGDASFDGGDEFLKITAGKLVLRGNMQQLGTTSTGAFRALGTHQTIFAGSTNQSVAFANWGASSLFDVIIDKTGGTISFSDGGEADGATSIISPTLLTSDNQYITNALKVAAGASVNVPAMLLPSGDSLQVLGDYTATFTHFQSFQGTGGGTIPSGSNLHYTNITSDGGFVAPALVMAGTFTSETGDIIFTGLATIFGDLIASVGSFNIDGQSVLVGGNFQTRNGGHLTMNTVGDSLDVAGDVTFAGGDELGRLTAGTLVIGGNFQQSAITSTTSFAPGGTHRTAFRRFEGTQNAFFDSPGSANAGSHFQNLDLTSAIGGGIVLNVNTQVDGALISAGSGAILGGGATLTVHQLQVSGLLADNVTIALDEQTVLAEVFDNVNFQNLPGTGALGLSVSGAGGNRTLIFDNVNFPALPVGAGNLYVRLISTNGQSFVLDMQDTNQGGGTGAVLSDPPDETVVNGAQVIWRAT